MLLLLNDPSRVRINLSDLNGGFDTDPCSFQHSAVIEFDTSFPHAMHDFRDTLSETNQNSTVKNHDSLIDKKEHYLKRYPHGFVHASLIDFLDIKRFF